MKDKQFDESTKLLSSFMRTTERAIVNRFAKLPGAVKLDIPQSLPAVYVPGTRTDKVLLVSHYDTVWDAAKIKLETWGTMLVSAHSKRGIGADDRAGIAALWRLRDSGHSLLIVPDEEVGCIGSQAVVAHHRHLLTDERFAIQFDRRGARDLVYYSCANPKFKRFMASNMPGYSEAIGSVSDISVLCPALGIAGVNISIGFEHEHTASEQLDVLDWYRTVTTVAALLDGHCPRYIYKRARFKQKGSGYGQTSAKYKDDGRGYDYGGDQFDQFRTTHQLDGSRDDYDAWHQYQAVMDASQDDDSDIYFWCRDCASMYDLFEVSDNEICSSCGGPLTQEIYTPQRTI
jgi:hypothetical protein